MSSKPRISFGIRKNSGVLKEWFVEIVVTGGVESTHWYRKPGSVAVAGPARTPANSGFGLQRRKNLRSCGPSNLNTLPPVYRLRPYSHLRFQANPNPMFHPR